MAKNVKRATSKDDMILKVAKTQNVAPYQVGIKDNGEITVNSYGTETVVGCWWKPTDD